MRGKFLPTMELDPTGMLAMQGQHYPITDLGIEEVGSQADARANVIVVKMNAMCNFAVAPQVGGRVCTMLTVTHPIPRAYFDFHVAEIFIDDELRIPVRYAAYSWPTTQGGERELLEEYTYQKVQLNVGLSDADFDRNNKKYNF